MTDLRIWLLGRFQVTVGGMPVPETAWRGERSRTLLQFLATRPEHRASSDELMETLWPHLPPDQARQNLHVTVSRLRRALASSGPGSPPGAQCVLSAGAGYRLADSTWVDLDDFRALVREVRSLNDQDPAVALARIRQFGYPQLPDLAVDQPYADWACAARERLRRDYLSLQTAHADLLQQIGHLQQALNTLLNVLELEPVLESVARQAMLIAHNLGNRVLALSIFDQCRRALAEELGVDPLPETLALHAQLLRGGERAPAGARRRREGGSVRWSGAPRPGARLHHGRAPAGTGVAAVQDPPGGRGHGPPRR